MYIAKRSAFNSIHRLHVFFIRLSHTKKRIPSAFSVDFCLFCKKFPDVLLFVGFGRGKRGPDAFQWHCCLVVYILFPYNVSIRTLEQKGKLGRVDFLYTGEGT